MENAQAVLKALNAPGEPGERITAIGRQLGYFGYLSLDNIVWVMFLTFTIRHTCRMLNSAFDHIGPYHQVLSPAAVYGTEA